VVPLLDNRLIDGFATPEDAARSSMPAAITHVVESRLKAGGDAAYVLLAVEVAGTATPCPESTERRAR
jgi:hypothetical protein